MKRRLELQNKNWMRRNFGEQGFDLFNIRLNRKSNNHGESWRTAFRFTAKWSFIIYVAYYTSMHWRHGFSADGILPFIAYYFSFLDITHKIDFLSPGGEITWYTRILDFIGRVVLGYCLYQLIAAFRRHGRKSGA